MPNILLVDTSDATRRLVADVLAVRPEWTVVEAAEGQHGLTLAGLVPLDLVLADASASGPGGLPLHNCLAAEQPLLPIIVMLEAGDEDAAALALQAGAAGYVSKRRLYHELIDVVERMLSVAAKDHGPMTIEALQAGQSTSLELGNDLSRVSEVVRYLTSQCCRFGVTDAAEQIRVAVALEEALLNAIIHGNLEVGSELRERSDDAYRQAVESRRHSREYGRRRVYLRCEVDSTQARFIVRDEGPGFDVRTLPDPRDPENLTRASGRGVLLMRAFMDEVVYNGLGNEVTLVKHRSSTRSAASPAVSHASRA